MTVLKNGYLASADAEGVIKIWDTDNGVLIRTLTGHTGAVNSLAVLQNGYLASGSSDNSIKIWDTENGVLNGTLIGNVNVNALAVLENGNLASSSYQEIKIWDIKKCNLNSCLLRTISGTSYFYILSLVALKNGYLASVCVYETIKIYKTDDGSLVKTIQTLDPLFSIAHLTVFLNNDYLAGAGSGNINIWHVSDGNISTIFSINDHRLFIYALAFFKNDYLAIGCIEFNERHVIKIYAVNDGSLVCTIPAHDYYIYSLVELPNGFLVSGSGDYSIKIWTINT